LDSDRVTSGEVTAGGELLRLLLCGESSDSGLLASRMGDVMLTAFLSFLPVRALEKRVLVRENKLDPFLVDEGECWLIGPWLVGRVLPTDGNGNGVCKFQGRAAQTETGAIRSGGEAGGSGRGWMKRTSGTSSAGDLRVKGRVEYSAAQCSAVQCSGVGDLNISTIRGFGKACTMRWRPALRQLV
jgi:hypothetical protein